jgi:NTE family protein
MHRVRFGIRFLPVLAYFVLACGLSPVGAETLIPLDREWVTEGGKSVVQAPRIGLALSGGGARGAAHVGVLKILEELNVPVHAIAGTSMGAIVGGLYAAGFSVAEIESALDEIPWRQVFANSLPREERRFRRRQDDYNSLTDQALSVQSGRIRLAPAVIQGQQLQLALQRYTLRAQGVESFDRLPIPFRAVATDITTGEAVIMGSGDLEEALRASMAVPAIFPAVEREGRLLVDGGIAMNLPVSVVRDMGVDIVIAVDISAPLLEREQIQSAVDVLRQLSNIVTRRETAVQRALLTADDILIVPELGEDIGSTDFEPQLLQLAVERGVLAARSQAPVLSSLGSDATMLRAVNAALPDQTVAPPTVDFVRIDNQTRLADEVLASRVRVVDGEPLDLDAIESTILAIHALGGMDSVVYRLEESDADGVGLQISARERAGGTSTLQFGLELVSIGQDRTYFNLAGAYTQQPLNAWNGEWRTVLRLGDEPGLQSEWYQPLDPQEDWFGRISAGHWVRRFRTYEPPPGRQALGEFTTGITDFHAALGRTFGDDAAVSLAFQRSSGSTSRVIGADSTEDFDFNRGKVELRLDADTLDSLYFPKRGRRAALYASTFRPQFGDDLRFSQYGGLFEMATQVGRNRLSGVLSFDTTSVDEVRLVDQFRLGGLGRLSGLAPDQLRGPHAVLARGTYRWDLGTRFLSNYAGVTLEAGNVWPQRDAVRLDDLVIAGSVFLTTDTPLGPVFAGYGRADTGQGTWYFILGKPWSLP